MDCKTALRFLEVCRPSGADLTDPELAPALAHVEQCPECLAEFRARQSLDTRVNEVVRSVSVPAGLCERIFDRLDRTRVYRMRRRAVLWTAAAASLVIAAGILVRSFVREAPTALAAQDLGKLIELADLEGQQSAPLGLEGEQLAAWCSARLRRHRVVGTPPAVLPSVGLAGVALARLSGSLVAVFQFRYGDPAGGPTYDADVFALPRSRFAIDGTGADPVRISQTRNPSIIAWVEGDTTYVAVFKGWLPKEWERLRGPSRRQAVT
jgi:hypothetical protein